jgi:hypothetical protein
VGRRIIYRIEDRYGNQFTEGEWKEVERLQHWYNSEFSWSTGRLAFKRYALFPNAEDFAGLQMSVWDIIAERHQSLRTKGLTEPEIIAQMEKERLVVVKWGGYYDECLASGFTRVADNEWNAFLACDFLLKASTILTGCSILVSDEGKFIKSGSVSIRNASVIVPRGSGDSGTDLQELCRLRRVFSVVDADKYARHPAFRNMIPEFNKLQATERKKLVRNWNWLGYDGNYDENGDDMKGFDLNLKVRSFELAE